MCLVPLERLNGIDNHIFCPFFFTVSKKYTSVEILDTSKPDYVAQTWEEKTDQIMAQVMEEPSPGTFPNVACKSSKTIFLHTSRNIHNIL